jgi:hypothetical protein
MALVLNKEHFLRIPVSKGFQEFSAPLRQKSLRRLEGLEDSHFSKFNMGIETLLLLERCASRGKITSG